MTESTGHAPNWYPDPWGRHEHRYFDGQNWTEHVASHGRQQDEQPGDRKPLGVRRARHAQPEQALAHEEEHRPAEHHRQADAVRGLPRLGDEQIVAHRHGDDAGHDRHVQVGVGIAR